MLSNERIRKWWRYSEEKKEREELRKKYFKELEEDKEITVSHMSNGKKVYFRLTEETFFNSSVSEKLVSNQQIKAWSI